MGYGSYSSSDWAKLKTSRKIDSGDYNTIFTSDHLNTKFDPQFIGKRKSCDSDEHPLSTPIIVGVDVTGSMGYLSENIIKKSLNELMMKLYSTDMVRDPQLLFAAIGDVNDRAPLQVTQFESDIRIAEQLLDLWIEGKGGDQEEDYELLWYFAANHTEIDSFIKRGKKGFCFSIGDAPCHSNLSYSKIATIFKDDIAPEHRFLKKNTGSVTSKALADEASEQYEVFHINIGDHANGMSSIIPGRVATVARNEIDYLPHIIISIIQLVGGMKKDAVLDQWNDLERAVVRRALQHVNVKKGNALIF